MMGECNCACMPLQKPFGRSALIVSAFLFFLQFSFFGFGCIFPNTPLFGLLFFCFSLYFFIFVL